MKHSKIVFFLCFIIISSFQVKAFSAAKKSAIYCALTFAEQQDLRILADTYVKTSDRELENDLLVKLDHQVGQRINAFSGSETRDNVAGGGYDDAIELARKYQQDKSPKGRTLYRHFLRRVIAVADQHNIIMVVAAINFLIDSGYINPVFAETQLERLEDALRTGELDILRIPKKKGEGCTVYDYYRDDLEQVVAKLKKVIDDPSIRQKLQEAEDSSPDLYIPAMQAVLAGSYYNYATLKRWANKLEQALGMDISPQQRTIIEQELLHRIVDITYAPASVETVRRKYNDADTKEKRAILIEIRDGWQFVYQRNLLNFLFEVVRANEDKSLVDAAVSGIEQATHCLYPSLFLRSMNFLLDNGHTNSTLRGLWLTQLRTDIAKGRREIDFGHGGHPAWEDFKGQEKAEARRMIQKIEQVNDSAPPLDTEVQQQMINAENERHTVYIPAIIALLDADNTNYTMRKRWRHKTRLALEIGYSYSWMTGGGQEHHLYVEKLEREQLELILRKIEAKEQ